MQSVGCRSMLRTRTLLFQPGGGGWMQRYRCGAEGFYLNLTRDCVDLHQLVALISEDVEEEPHHAAFQRLSCHDPIHHCNRGNVCCNARIRTRRDHPRHVVGILPGKDSLRGAVDLQDARVARGRRFEYRRRRVAYRDEGRINSPVSQCISRFTE